MVNTFWSVLSIALGFESVKLAGSAQNEIEE